MSFFVPLFLSSSGCRKTEGSRRNDRRSQIRVDAQPHSFRWTLTLVIALALGLGAFPRASAQIEMGGVAGTVKDATGAVIPEAVLTLTNQQTGVVQTARSTPTGTYVFGYVPVGTFTLRAKHAGFDSVVIKNLSVHLQQVITQDITLPVGRTEQQVTVTSSAPLLQAESAAVGTTVEAEQLNNLPLNGRNWASLAQLSAGVTTASTIFSGAPGSAYFSIDGVNVWQTDFRLDGIDDNVEMYGGPGVTNSNVNVTPPPDAVQEFKMQNGNFSAEFGHSTGGIINAVIKSGTNRVHGDFWEFIRNDAFDANDYFSKQYGAPIPEYRQNQFGFTVGGPVMLPGYNGKNRTFFFFDWQGTRIINPRSYTSTVPTTGENASGFTNLEDLISGQSGTKTDALGRIFPYGAVLDPATTRAVAAGAIDPTSGFANTSASTVYVRDPFYTGGSVTGIRDFTALNPGTLNQIPQGRLDPNAVAMLKLYPAPTSSGYSNNYYLNAKMPETINQFDLRIDESLKDHDTLFAVYDWSHLNVDTPNSLPGLADGGQWGTGSNIVPVYMIALGEAHIFSPTLSNDLHAGWSNNVEHLISGNSTTMGVPEKYGIQGIPQVPYNGGLPDMNISGLATLGSSGFMPTLSTISTLELMDNVTKLKGSHSFKFGMQFDRMYGAIFQPSWARGQFNISGQYSDVPNSNTGALGMADFLLTPTQSTVANGIDNLGGLSGWQASNIAYNRDIRFYTGAFFQDDWKATSTLTFNLGLRWDYFTPYAEINGRQANFIQDGGDGSTGTYYIPSKGSSVKRAPAFDAMLADAGIKLVTNDKLATGTSQKTNFAPRVGFAKRLTPTLVVRGGYGIAYGALANLGFGPTLGNNYPYAYVNGFNSINSQTAFLNPNGQAFTVENAMSSVNVQDPALVTPYGLNLKGRQYNYKTPYSEAFNTFMQWQFAAHDAVQLGYVGNLGRHLDTVGWHNQPTKILPPGTNIYDYLPFPNIAPNSDWESTTDISTYNSIQLTYQHEMSHGLNMLANYAYSTCRTSQGFYAAANEYVRAQWLPGFGTKGDYSFCDTDATNVVHAAGEYKLPVGRGSQYLGTMNRAADAVIGGWSVNYIYTFQSGQPFTVGCPTSTTADYGCFANEVPGQGLYTGAHRIDQWLNPKAFAQPPVATQVGQTDFAPLGGPPMVARGPHFNNIDFSVFKQFSFEPIGKLEFRAEAFNLTNTPQFGMPGNTAGFLSTGPGNPNQFSTITSLRNTPRLLQFALKFDY